MYAAIPAALIALTPLISFGAANPIATRSDQHPYFAVSGFSYSKSSTSSRYQFNVSFPQDVAISPSSAGPDPFIVPGFTDPVPCTGTYFTDPSSNITAINACGYINGDADSPNNVTSKLDVVNGILYLTYRYNGHPVGAPPTQKFWYNGTQTGLVPVTPENKEGFNTPASGPGVYN